MSRTKHHNRNTLIEGLRPVKSYKRLQKHMIEKEYELA